MPLLFLPDRRSYFVWEDEPAARRFLPPAPRGRGADLVQLVLPARKAEVPGRLLPLVDTSTRLAALSAREMAELPATFACWAAASKLLLALLARERVVPVLVPAGSGFEARWQVSLQVPADAAAFLVLSRSLPPAAHALPLGKGASREVWLAAGACLAGACAPRSRPGAWGWMGFGMFSSAGRHYKRRQSFRNDPARPRTTPSRARNRLRCFGAGQTTGGSRSVSAARPILVLYLVDFEEAASCR